MYMLICLLVSSQNCKHDKNNLKKWHPFQKRKKKEQNMNARRSKKVFLFCPASFFPCGFPLQIPAWCWVGSSVDRCGLDYVGWKLPRATRRGKNKGFWCISGGKGLMWFYRSQNRGNIIDIKSWYNHVRTYGCGPPRSTLVKQKYIKPQENPS